MMVGVWLFSAVVLGAFQPPPAADRPPAPLSQLHDSAIALYAPALAGEWSTASERLTTVDDAMAALPARVGKPDLVQQLRGHVAALRRAVRSHQAVRAAANANWIARLADEISVDYETAVPTDARLLAFFGRAVEVDAKGNRQHVTADLADLRTVWRRVEPMVLQRSAVDVARKFADALVDLDGARAGDLANAAEAEVAASAQVVAVFRSRQAAP